MNIESIAAQIAIRAHDGQYRRGGTPYISHPSAVVKRLLNESSEVIAVAWLHDVLEDTSETLESLQAANLPDNVIRAVQILTKTEDKNYEEYLRAVKQCPIARKVKIADMMHNLSDKPTDKQIVKYTSGSAFLCAD